ncbi:DUF4376 domain-containing protein [Halomonas sp. SL1]|nr:DUF4376 domain-containing protein [Halomonas sp. SL1]
MRREPRIPAGATSSEPPATGKREAARWSGQAWEIVSDWRGHVYWLADGSRHEITELGVEPPADGLDEQPPASLDTLAARQRAAIAAALADALAAGMAYTMPDGTEETVQMLAEDRQNLLGLAIEARDLKAADETGAVQEFRGLSNTRYPMTPDETIALTDAALGHYKVLKARSWDRKDAITQAFKAGDREGIEAVVW